MKAMTKFEPSRGVAFKTFAKPYIHGAIFDGSELNRGLARTLEENYRKIRTAEAKLTNILRRNPTREEVAERTKLTPEQIQNAIDAMSAAFASALPESEDSSAANSAGVAQMESALLVQEALSMLSEREAKVVVHYYLEDQSAEQIADALGLTASNVTKIRQRALRKMSKLLDDVDKKA
jgi:RNA polymerase sigma factor for flagellar operon FliA